MIKLLLAGLSLGAISYSLWPRVDPTLVLVRRTAPDSLQAYALKPEERAALAAFYQARQMSADSVVQRWVYARRCRLQRTGLQLLEQSMLLRWRAQNPLASTKLDTAIQLGQWLARSNADSFLWRETGKLQRLSGQVLAERVALGENFAVARALFLQRHYGEAADWLTLTRVRAREMHEHKFFIDASYLLQYALRREKQLKRVIALGEEILQAASSSGYRYNLAAALAETADAYFEMSALDSAQVFVERALAFGESFGDTLGLARGHFSQAQIYLQAGNYDEAERSLARVLEFDALQTFRGQALSLQGGIALFHSEYARAEGYYREALKIYTARREQGNRIQTLIELSKIKTLIGEFENALAFAREAYEVGLQEHEPLRSALALSQTGWTHLQRDSLAQAVAALKQALKLLPDSSGTDYANTLVTLGNVHLQQNALAAAHMAFARAAELAQAGNSNIIAIESRIGQGWVALAQSNTAAAHAWFVSALDSAKRFHEASLAGAAYFGIAATQRQNGEHAAALQTLEQALAIGETLRSTLAHDSSRVSYFATRQDWFEAAIVVALQKGEPELALQYAERGRARALQDALATMPAPHEIGTSFDVMTTAEMQRRMPANIQALEYRVTAKAVFVWCITKDKLRLRRIDIDASALADTILQLQRSLGAAGNEEEFRERCRLDAAQVYAENRRYGKMLYELLLAPIAEELNADKTLYLIPDGPLHVLPWGALVDANNNFFDETHMWTKAPSLQILTRNSAARSHLAFDRNTTLLMVTGNVNTAAAETRALRQLFPNFKLLQGAEASLPQVQRALATGAGIAYFSTQAVADMYHPLNSYIELADESSTASGVSRQVYVREWQSWNWASVDLVILNACETASGKIVRGEGGMSMASFLVRARVPHVVASLWKNDGRFSAQLMNDFLRALQTNGDAIASLQSAKRAGIRKLKQDYQYPFPYFWATFELQNVGFFNSTHQPLNQNLGE